MLVANDPIHSIISFQSKKSLRSLREAIVEHLPLRECKSR